jgi:C-terminal processing protease CtpA/Prc
LTTSNGTEQKIELQGVTATEINNSRVAKYNRRYSQYGEDWEAWRTESKPALRFEMKEAVAVMTLRTFHIYTIEGKGQKYEEFLTQAFNQLTANKITELIIDLRNNHGGHDEVGMALMSQLHDSAFSYYKRRAALVKPKGKFVKKGNVYELVGRGVQIGNVMPMPQIYGGNVYVLMNGYSVSAAGEFIGHLKNVDRATFIGEEAGGNPVIFTGGQSLSVDLPHTRITGIIPLSLNEMNVRLKNTGRGVMPDHEIKPSIKDILEEKDVEMELVLKLIREKRNN